MRKKKSYLLLDRGLVFIVLTFILITHLHIWKVFLTHSTDKKNEVQKESWFPKVWNREINSFMCLFLSLTQLLLDMPAKDRDLIQLNMLRAKETHLSERLWCLPCPQMDSFISWMIIVCSHMHGARQSLRSPELAETPIHFYMQVLFLIIGNDSSRHCETVWKYCDGWKCLHSVWLFYLSKSTCQNVYDHSFKSFT